MGYVFNFQDATSYEKWFGDKRNILAAGLEVRLMKQMLKPLRNERVLDIGCGTGVSLLPLLEMGLDVTGIDPSPYMLDLAKNKFKTRVDFHRGYAEDLPFEDNSFNYSCFFTSLEFVENPEKAIEEACRVTKDRIFIGVLNKYAVKGFQRRVKGIFTHTIYNRARFFSVWELKHLARKIMGNVPITWRTVCLIPGISGGFAKKIENSSLTQKCPFGAFAGIVITLTPSFRTTPLTLKYKPPARKETARGYVRG